MIFKRLSHAIATNSILKRLFISNECISEGIFPLAIDVTVRYTGKIFISEEEAKQIAQEIEDEILISTLAESLAKRFLEQEEQCRTLSQCDAIEEIYFGDED